MVPEIVAVAVAVGHLLVAGPAVDVYQHGIFLVSVNIKVVGRNSVIVQFGKVRGVERAKDFMLGAVVEHLALQFAVVL